MKASTSRTAISSSAFTRKVWASIERDADQSAVAHRDGRRIHQRMGCSRVGNTVFVADGVGGLVTVDVTNPRCAAGARPRRDRRAGARCGRRRTVRVRRRGLGGSRGRRRLGPGQSHRRRAARRCRGRRCASTTRRAACSWRPGTTHACMTCRIRRRPRFIGAARMTRDSTSPRTIARRPPRASSESRRESGMSSSATGIRSIRIACFPIARRRTCAFPKPPAWSTSVPWKSARAGPSPFPLTNQGTAPLTVFSSRVTGAAFSVTPNTLSIRAGRDGASLADLSCDRHNPARRAICRSCRTTLRRSAAHGLSRRQPARARRRHAAAGDDRRAARRHARGLRRRPSGKVMLLNFFATFCPVCGGQLPDVEARFWQKYRDRGLVVVSLNAHDARSRSGRSISTSNISASPSRWGSSSHPRISV